MSMSHVTPRMEFLEPDAVTALGAGLEVRGVDNRPIGTLHGFLVDSESRCAVYAVVEHSALAPDHYHYVPIGATEYDESVDVLRLRVPVGELSTLPSYAVDALVDLPEPEYDSFRSSVAHVFGDEETSYREPDWWKASAQARERAQPGSVLGLETDGERTHLGETADDEHERREEAEEKTRRDRA